MSLTEIQANPQQFTCTTCPHALWDDDLWAVNRRALDLYRRLCGRTTVDLGLAGWLFQTLTTGWPTPDVLDLLARIECIREVLDPPRKPSDA